MTESIETPRSEQERAAIDRLTTVMANAATDRVEERIPGLVESLHSVGAHPIVLKGPVTRQRLYGPDERRPVADVDVLVEVGAFGRARRALERLGYVRVDRHGHSDAFHSTDPDAPDVDLHLTLPYVTVAPRRAFEVLSSHVTRLDVGGMDVHVLDEPAHVVHLAIHAAVNRFEATSRTFTEWQRGHASLDTGGLAGAHRIAMELGVKSVWDLACAALGEKESRDSIAACLPTWEAVPRVVSVRGFLTSGTPLMVKWRDFQRLVALQVSDGTLNAWRTKNGRQPFPSGSWQIRLAKPVRLVVVSLRGVGRTLVGGFRRIFYRG